MQAKKWLLLSFTLFGVILLSLWSFIYLTDPYGYFSKKDKFIKNLTHLDHPNIIHNKLLVKNDIYILGSSRQMRINPIVVEQYTNKSVQNIAQVASTLEETIFFAKKVKKMHKNFIFSFDAFTLNQSRMQANPEIKNRFITYKDEFHNTKSLYLNLFNMDLLSSSIKHHKLYFKDKSFDYNEIKENNSIYDFNISILDNEFSHLDDNNNIGPNFSQLYKHYTSYPDNVIIDLAKLATKDDIFIIYPKYAYYYKLFQNYAQIEKKYFHAIKVLVENTDARVWSFYDINPTTLESKNFDLAGWHFKPKIGEMMFKIIYKKEKDDELIAFQLNKENVESHLKNISSKVAKSFK